MWPREGRLILDWTSGGGLAPVWPRKGRLPSGLMWGRRAGMAMGRMADSSVGKERSRWPDSSLERDLWPWGVGLTSATGLSPIVMWLGNPTTGTM